MPQRSSLYYNRVMVALSPLGSVVVESKKPANSPASPRPPTYASPQEDADDLSNVNPNGDEDVSTDDALNPRVSLCGHFLITIVFVLLVLAYIAVALAGYFTREEAVEYMQETSLRQNPIPLTLEIACSNAPNCGNATLTINYTAIGGCGMHGPALEVRELPHVLTTSDPLRVPVDLCLTPDAVFSSSVPGPLNIPGITVDFFALNPGVIPPVRRHGHAGLTPAPELLATGEVAVTFRQDSAYAGTGTRAMRRLISLSSWQVKTLIVGTTITTRDGRFENQQPAPVAVQYEGRRTNWRGTLILARPLFATVVDRTMPGTLLQVLAGIGGATLLLAAAFVVLLPLWARIFPAAKTVDRADRRGVKENDDVPMASVTPRSKSLE